MTDEELKQLVAANARDISELRASISELRASTSELRASTGDLRASISDLRDIVGGHERRIIRLEGKEIDTWGDYLTLLDRVRKLEEWKRKLEEEGK
jgi:chromosome segregation ATPase